MKLSKRHALVVAAAFVVGGGITTAAAAGSFTSGSNNDYNIGSDAVNYAGYQQARDIPMHRLSSTQAAQQRHPSDLTLLGGGGCTPGYGKGSECLPVTPPAAAAMDMNVDSMPWTCSQVRQLFPQGIVLTLRGRDPAHLDSNGDGIACGKGDVR